MNIVSDEWLWRSFVWITWFQLLTLILDNFIFTYDLHEQFSDQHSAYNKDRKEKQSSDQLYFAYNFQNLNKSYKNREIVEKFTRIAG